jgi:hypothetical protein
MGSRLNLSLMAGFTVCSSRLVWPLDPVATALGSDTHVEGGYLAYRFVAQKRVLAGNLRHVVCV